MPNFWNFTEPDDGGDPELRIDGEIVSDDDAWVYEWLGIKATAPNAFRAALAAYKGRNLTVWIDSWGGDVFAGAGIYNALKEHDGKVTVKIDGKAVSAASVIAMAGDEVLMSPVGILMIHNPWCQTVGEARDMRHAADVMDEVKETILNAYLLKTGLDRRALAKLMDEETWMSALKAQEQGFVDGVLYADATEGNPAPNAFAFSRMAIQNSASSVMRRFLTQAKELESKPEPDPDLSKLTNLRLKQKRVALEAKI